MSIRVEGESKSNYQFIHMSRDLAAIATLVSFVSLIAIVCTCMDYSQKSLQGNLHNSYWPSIVTFFFINPLVAPITYAFNNYAIAVPECLRAKGCGSKEMQSAFRNLLVFYWGATVVLKIAECCISQRDFHQQTR